MAKPAAMLLALDTCFNACSVALFDDVRGAVVASRLAVMERGHAEAIGPMVEAVFEEAGIAPSVLTRIAVTYGPGTFTGLRIGLAYAKGMALALDIPLVGLDSLTAAIAPHFHIDGEIAVVYQAGRSGLCYWMRFDGAAAKPLIPPSLSSLADVIVGLKDDTLYVFLDEKVDPDLLQIEGREIVPVNLDAKYFAAYAATLPSSFTEVVPLYLRAPDAKPSVSAEASTARVRLVKPDDLEAMSAIHMQSFDHGWTAESFGSSLSLPGAGALVVELAGTVYGFVQYQWVAGEAEINTICVSPNYRRQHFGHELLRGLIDYLKTIRTQKVFLEVASGNLAARRLYDHHGFQPTGLRRGYYADGQDAITMTLELRA